MLTEERINTNFINFIGKLKKYGAYPKEMEDDSEFNESLRLASAFINEDSGGAYKGSLVEHITRIATIAYHLNSLLIEEVRVPLESLIKVCYLHQIAKCIMIVENKTEWEIKKGKLFTYVKDLPAMKCSEFSIYLCNKYGIKLTEDECEAILSTDKDDDQTKFFSGILASILKSSINLAVDEKKTKYRNSLKG